MSDRQPPSAGRPLAVLGTGGHASVVIDLALSAGHRVLGCAGPTAPQFPETFCPYLGDDGALDALDPEHVDAAIGIGAVGDPALRRDLFEQVLARGFAVPPLVHPSAVVAATSRIEAGAQVMAGAVVQPFAHVGRNVIVNTGAIVEHHADIGDHAHIAPGAVICGNVAIGASSHVGAGAIVRQGITVGAEVMIAAGAVVVTPLPDKARVMGVPAR